VSIHPPKFVRPRQWPGYDYGHWPRSEKKDVTVLYSYVERRKSYFFRAWLERKGYRYIDMGDHVKEDVNWGKEYGNRMECNPMYFTSGAFIRHLFKIQEETGLSQQEIVERYIFLCGGGQCGPCRYGMYPQEYLKVANEAGFKGFRILIFSSDIGDPSASSSGALKMNLDFKINIFLAALLADLMHVAECALRPRARDRDQLEEVLERAERTIFEAFRSPLYLARIPRALRRMGRMLAAVERRTGRLPLIFITGEFFANLAHNYGNYNLRRFIADEGCEAIPGLFVQRILYDNWRRTQEARRGIRYATDPDEQAFFRKSLRKQKNSTAIIKRFVNQYVGALDPGSFGGRWHLLDLDELARQGEPYYHPHIFGGESNLEVGEAIHYADEVDGFISVKPFGCMPSSGVSDGVQTKIMSMFPALNFLSIETSGDNDVNILSRVSMLLFRAKQKVAAESVYTPLHAR
jgi:predicted nucleotide-binding protein (sugar kinase/HSP70/actin superfamily)